MILGRGTAGARRVWPAGVLAGFQVALLGLAFLVRKARFLRNGDGGRADRAPRRDVGSAEASNRPFPTSTRVRGGSGMGESRSHLGTWARSPRASTAGEPKEGRGELH